MDLVLLPLGSDLQFGTERILLFWFCRCLSLAPLPSRHLQALSSRTHCCTTTSPRKIAHEQTRPAMVLPIQQASSTGKGTEKGRSRKSGIISTEDAKISKPIKKLEFVVGLACLPATLPDSQCLSLSQTRMPLFACPSMLRDQQPSRYRQR